MEPESGCTTRLTILDLIYDRASVFYLELLTDGRTELFDFYGTFGAIKEPCSEGDLMMIDYFRGVKDDGNVVKKGITSEKWKDGPPQKTHFARILSADYEMELIIPAQVDG